MKSKALLVLLLLISAVVVLFLAHKNYKPNIIKISKPVSLKPLAEMDQIIATSKAKDRGMIMGRALDESKEHNIFTADGGIIQATQVTQAADLPPPEYPGRLVAISSVDGKPGALIECQKPIIKDAKNAAKNAPKPAIGGAPARPAPNQQLQRNQPIAGKNTYTSPLKGPGYYKEGDTMVDGAVLKKVNFDDRSVTIFYTDSDYTLKLKNDWEALNKVMEEYRNQEQKRAADEARKRQIDERERRISEWRKANPNGPNPDQIRRMRDMRSRNNNVPQGPPPPQR